MKKFYENLNDCFARDSREDLYQNNIYHNLLIKELGYSENKDIEERRNNSGIIIPDITISFGSFKCLVEIKRDFVKYKQENEGLSQLANYLKKKKVSFGILTDSTRWILIQTHPTRNSYKIILNYKISAERRTKSLWFLKKLSKGRISHLFEMCSDVIGEKGYEWLTQKALYLSHEEFKQTILSIYSKCTANDLRLLSQSLEQFCFDGDKTFYSNSYIKI
jgi:hypothetical protein